MSKERPEVKKQLAIFYKIEVVGYFLELSITSNHFDNFTATSDWFLKNTNEAKCLTKMLWKNFASTCWVQSWVHFLNASFDFYLFVLKNDFEFLKTKL